MKFILVPVIMGALIGVGGFFAWRASILPPEEKPVIREFPKTEADLDGWRYFDLRGSRQALVTIDQGAFNPEIIIVDKGAEVFWKNMDRADHSVSVYGQWRVLKRNESFSIIFDTPGNYSYQSDSDKIKGLIIVK